MKNVIIYPIVTGYSTCDEATYLFMKGKAGKQVEIPMICFYIEGLEKKVLIDTGICDADRANKYHHPTNPFGVGPSNQLLIFYKPTKVGPKLALNNAFWWQKKRFKNYLLK